MSKYKIKINCTEIQQLSYNNSKITNKDKEKYKFDDINYIDEVYVLYRKIIKENFILKSLEFIINKSLDIEELQDFLKILKNKGFSSDNNTTVEFIDITDNNNHNYLYKIRYNTLKKIDYKYKIKINCTKIKINCTKINDLSYNNSKITKEDINKYKFDNINKIEFNTEYNKEKKSIEKSIEFIINKLLDSIELQEFLIILKNKGFASNNNTTVDFIDITMIKPIYLYGIKYNTFEIIEYKRKSKYSQHEIFKR